MDKKVKEFLDKRRQEIERKKEEKKAKTLISLDLYEKVYSPDGYYSFEYNLSEWDSNEQTTKYYKKVPVAVSDEEFEEIQKFSNKTTDEKMTEANPVAIALTVIAWVIFIGGFIAGIVFGNVEVKGYYSDYTEFSFAIALTCWAISLIHGTLMLGFAEAIKLLNDIKNKK